MVKKGAFRFIMFVEKLKSSQLLTSVKFLGQTMISCGLPARWLVSLTLHGQAQCIAMRESRIGGKQCISDRLVTGTLRPIFHRQRVTINIYENVATRIIYIKNIWKKDPLGPAFTFYFNIADEQSAEPVSTPLKLSFVIIQQYLVYKTGISHICMEN